MNKKEIGNKNEKLAQKYLQENNYQILKTNFSTRFGEIDIIAQKDEFLVFIEVRSKSYTYFGKPFETVNKNKIQKIVKTAQVFISENNLKNLNIRFDVISIINGKINHIESAFDLDFLL